MAVRLAVRAVIVERGRLLLVNAYRDVQSDLWCAPGGGVVAHASLPENLAREVREETGLAVAVGAPCLVNEFHDPDGGFHQVDLFFRCTVTGGVLSEAWRDPEGVVARRRFFTEAELATIRVKPDRLRAAAFSRAWLYDPLEPLERG